MTQSPSAATVREALAPTREALRAAARADADAARARAEQAVAQVLATAEMEAVGIRSRAHEVATEQARSLMAGAESHARRTARAIELDARREAYDSLAVAARAEAARLLDDPEALDALRALARRAAGPGADLVRTEDGVAAEDAGRRIEFSMSSLADEAVRDLLRDRGV